MADIVQPDIALKDLEERWGVARNTLKNWASKLGVDIKNPTPRSAYWPGEYIDLGDQLASWLRAGNELAAFPPILHQRSGDMSPTPQVPADIQQTAGGAITQTSGSQLAAPTPDSNQTAAIQRIDSISALPDEVDPHAAWDDFERAMTGRRWYSTDAMAVILRRTRGAVASWKDGVEVYPDCFLEKRKIGNDVYWRAFSKCQPDVIEGPDMSADRPEMSTVTTLTAEKKWRDPLDSAPYDTTAKLINVTPTGVQLFPTC